MSIKERIIRYRARHTELEAHDIEELDRIEEITDEIEKSLWIIKEMLDIPTEEVDKSVTDYKNNRTMFSKKKKRE